MGRVRPLSIKPIIGLTGGVGAGKSSVARVLSSLGCGVIDSDSLAREQYGDPQVVATLRSWWGDGVCRPAGEVDRAAVAGIVFSDRAALARLEGLLYPRLAARRRELIAGLERDPKVRAIVLDAPKLYEAGVDAECDVVVFVDAPRSLRQQRSVAARGWSAEEFDRREKMLDPLDRKKARADYVIVNHAGVTELNAQVERVFSSVLASIP